MHANALGGLRIHSLKVGGWAVKWEPGQLFCPDVKDIDLCKMVKIWVKMATFLTEFYLSSIITCTRFSLFLIAACGSSRWLITACASVDSTWPWARATLTRCAEGFLNRHTGNSYNVK